MPSTTQVFADVPEVARMWVIPTDRELDASDQTKITSHLEDFFRRWRSHGRKVEANCAIVHDRFIVVSAFIPGADVSGCGIDASVHELDEIADVVGFSRAPVLDVFFDDGGKVRSVNRAEFASLARQGRVTLRTTVFDTSISSAADWNRGAFTRPAADSWHAAVFF